MKRRASFTLVELLVVIAIIFLLASLLLPALGQAKEQGRRAVCISNLHQLGACIYAYGGDFNGYYPGPNARGRPSELAWTSGGQPDFRPVWLPYLSSPSLIYCPSNLSTFNPYRQQDPINGPGWFEGWYSTNGCAFSGYEYWPNWTYATGASVSSAWTNPSEQPTDRMESDQLRVIMTDHTMSYDVLPVAGYNWYNHRQGGGNSPYDSPGKPQWAATLYSDGSVLAVPANKWIVRVQTSNGLKWSW